MNEIGARAAVLIGLICLADLSAGCRQKAAVVAAPPFKAGALDFVVASLERAIEVFGLKLKAPEAKPLVSEKNV